MPKRDGFTLIEVIVVMVIIGVLAIFIVPGITTMMEQGMAQSAENNLLLIWQAEKSYFFNNGFYCATYASPYPPGASATCGDNLTDLINNLNLNIVNTNNSYAYVCSYNAPGQPPGLLCSTWRNVENSQGTTTGPGLALSSASNNHVECSVSGAPLSYCPSNTKTSGGW